MKDDVVNNNTAIKAHKYEIPTTEELAKQIKIEQDRFVDQTVQRLEKMVFDSFLKSGNDYVTLNLAFADSYSSLIFDIDIPYSRREVIFNKLQENLEAKGYFVTYVIPKYTDWYDISVVVRIDDKDTKLKRVTYAEAMGIENEQWKQNSKTYGLSEDEYEKLTKPKFSFISTPSAIMLSISIVMACFILKLIAQGVFS